MDNGAGRGGVRGWWADRPIRVKLGVLVAVLIVAGLGCGVVAIDRLGVLRDAGHANYQGQLRLRQLGIAQQSVALVRADLRDHLLSTDPAALVKFTAAINADDARVAEALTAFEHTGIDRVAVEGVAAFRENYAAYVKIRDDRVLPASAAGRKAEAYAVLTSDAVPVYKQAVEHLTNLVTHQVQQGAATAARSTRQYQQAVWFVAGDLLAGMVIGLWLAVMITHTIVRPVHAVAGMLDAMGAGDLTGRVDTGGRDEIGQMAASATRAAAQMSETIHEMADGASALAGAAAHLEQVSAGVAASAEQTADRAGAVAGTAAQISASVQTVADGAARLNAAIGDIIASAGNATLVGEEAVSAAGQTSQKVDRLGEASAEVTRVVELISAVAAQTGLLALNATIEAARAGAAGKGFAVVAGEVKALAQQAAAASDDVTRRIAAMQEETRVTAGAIGVIGSIIQRLEETHANITDAVGQQAETTVGITASVGQAATGAAEIAATVAGVAADAHATRVAVDSVRQAASDLTGLSDRLSDQVGRFRWSVVGDRPG